MNKTIIALATLSTLAFAAPALAGDYDAGERAAYAQTQRSEPALKLFVPSLVEGRNAAVVRTAKPKVESYITQQIELDARADRLRRASGGRSPALLKLAFVL